MKQRYLPAASLALISLGAGLSAAAQDIGVRVNGQPVAFTGAYPAQIQGRVLVPLRGVLEQMGASLVWDPATRTVIGSKDDRRFELPIGASSAIMNGRAVPLDVPAQIVRGTTMVPLRFVSEALGAEVRWSGATQTVEISTDQYYPGSGEPATERTGGAGLSETPLTSNPRSNPSGSTNLSNAEQPVIDSFSHSANGPLRAGETLQMEMEGTPGGRATFDVVGVATNVPMTEASPGHYVGKVTVPRGLNIAKARAFGRLAVGNRQAPLVQAGNAITVDAQPPQILNLTPAQGETINQARPDIYAEYRREGGVGVDTSSVHLLLNGQDVTDQARITPGFIYYTPTSDLNGPINVELRVADKAGNVQTAQSRFTVHPQAQGLISVSHNADKALAPGDSITVTVKAEPGGQAIFDIPGVVEGNNGVRMTEQTPGIYVGSYTVRANDKAYNVPIKVRFISKTLKISRMNAAQPVSLVGGTLARPTITEPKAGEKLTGSITVTGRAEPGSNVRVTLSTSGRLLGLLPIEGSDIVQEVRAGLDGTYKTDPLPLPRPAGAKNLRYHVEVVTTDPLGKTSEPTTQDFVAQ